MAKTVSKSAVSRGEVDALPQDPLALVIQPSPGESMGDAKQRVKVMEAMRQGKYGDVFRDISSSVGAKSVEDFAGKIVGMAEGKQRDLYMEAFMKVNIALYIRSGKHDESCLTRMTAFSEGLKKSEERKLKSLGHHAAGIVDYFEGKYQKSFSNCNLALMFLDEDKPGMEGGPRSRAWETIQNTIGISQLMMARENKGSLGNSVKTFGVIQEHRGDYMGAVTSTNAAMAVHHHASYEELRADASGKKEKLAGSLKGYKDEAKKLIKLAYQKATTEMVSVEDIKSMDYVYEKVIGSEAPPLTSVGTTLGGGASVMAPVEEVID